MPKRLKTFLHYFNDSPRARALLPLLLTAGFYLLHRGALADLTLTTAEFAKSGSGGFLIAGLPYCGTISHMPLPDFLVSAFYDAGLGAWPLLALLFAGLPALVFAAGALLGGYRAGLAALIGAGLFSKIPQYLGFEQVLYSCFLLLILCFVILARKERSSRNLLLCGFSIGASLLVRSPLFLFPPLLLLVLGLSGGKRNLSPGRAALFIMACYILLAPWTYLGRALTGETQFLEAGRGRTNLITTALGSIYTMEGNPSLLAGIDKDEDAAGFLLGKVRQDPGFYAVTALRRLWQLFLLQPLLLTLFLAAMLFGREKDKGPVFILPVYFILFHSMFSMEERYFVPLAFLLPPVIAGAFLGGRREREDGAGVFAGKTAFAAFLLSFTAVLGLELLMAAYPSRGAANKVEAGAIARLSGRFPRDRALYEQKCLELRARDEYAAYHDCLGSFDTRFGDVLGHYFLAALAARSSAEIPAPPVTEARFRLDFLIIRTLRELELGDQAAARTTLAASLEAYHSSASMLRGRPYKKDKELAAFLEHDNSFFYDLHLPRLLDMWPPQRARKILKELAKISAIREDLKNRYDGTGTKAGQSTGKLELFYGNFRLKGPVAGLPAGKARQTPAPAETHTPGALMDLCYSKTPGAAAGRALSACQELAALAASGTLKKTGSEYAEFDAQLQSCRLLNALGRGDEAREALLWTLATAPAAWPGLEQARRLQNDKTSR